MTDLTGKRVGARNRVSELRELIHTLPGGGTADLSGTGMPNGVVTASPGTYYTDTAGTNGAWRWLKKSGSGNTGWVVEHGDTGWRDITPPLPWGAVGGAREMTSGMLRLSRYNNVVTVQFRALVFNNSVATSYYDMGDANMLPTGFRNHSSFRPGVTMRNSDVTINFEFAFYAGRFLYFFNAFAPNGEPQPNPQLTPSTPPIWGEMSWITDDPWPTTLPGTPA